MNVRKKIIILPDYKLLLSTIYVMFFILVVRLLQNIPKDNNFHLFKLLK